MHSSANDTVKQDFEELMNTLREQKAKLDQNNQNQNQSLDESFRKQQKTQYSSIISKKSLSLPKIKSFTSLRDLQNESIATERSSIASHRFPQSIIKSAKFILNPSEKPQKLYFQVRAPWRNPNDRVTEVFDKNINPISHGRDLKASEIYKERYLLLDRSFNDPKTFDNKPFKLNTRYKASDFEVPSDILINKRAQGKLNQRRGEYDQNFTLSKQVEEGTHIERRQLLQLKNIMTCQMGDVQKAICEQTLLASGNKTERQPQNSQYSEFAMPKPLQLKRNQNHLMRVGCRI